MLYFYQIHNQLIYQDNISTDELDRSVLIPITIRSFSDRFNYTNFTARNYSDSTPSKQDPKDPWEHLISK